MKVFIKVLRDVLQFVKNSPSEIRKPHTVLTVLRASNRGNDFFLASMYFSIHYFYLNDNTFAVPEKR